ncbi:MAG: response regulator transcription factor [Mycobacteriales bacterium]
MLAVPGKWLVTGLFESCVPGLADGLTSSFVLGPLSNSARSWSVLSPLSSSGCHAAHMRVLLVEDDARLAAALHRALRGAGVVADVAATSEDAVWMVREVSYEAVVLDVMLPDTDGFETCRQLRAGGVWTPIIMVTARASIEDRVRGLDVGADDYLTKPFSLAELLARLRALVRRDPVERPSVISLGALRLDPATRRAWRGDIEIALSAREHALLEAFMRRPGQVLSQRQLIDAAWDFAFENPSNVVEVYVRYLREKIDRPFGTKSLETVRGIGYRMREDGGL